MCATGLHIVCIYLHMVCIKFAHILNGVCKKYAYDLHKVCIHSAC